MATQTVPGRTNAVALLFTQTIIRNCQVMKRNRPYCYKTISAIILVNKTRCRVKMMVH